MKLAIVVVERGESGGYSSDSPNSGSDGGGGGGWCRRDGSERW